MRSYVPGVITKGVQGAFFESLSAFDPIWPGLCTTTETSTRVEPYAWMGSVPSPRLMLDGRLVQNIRDFTYNIETGEHDMTFSIPRTFFEDDQTGQIISRIRECAEAWAIYQDGLLATALNNGGAAGSNAFDGLTYFHDTRTIGSSGTIDNKITVTVNGEPANLDVDGARSALMQARSALLSFNDDQGVPFNAAAIKRMAVYCSPNYEMVMREVLNAAILPRLQGSTPVAGPITNLYSGMADLFVSPHWSLSNLKFYVFATGSQSRMPFIMQKHSNAPLEVLVYDDPIELARNNGLMVLCRERFTLAYGDPRRAVEVTLA